MAKGKNTTRTTAVQTVTLYVVGKDVYRSRHDANEDRMDDDVVEVEASLPVGADSAWLCVAGAKRAIFADLDGGIAWTRQRDADEGKSVRLVQIRPETEIVGMFYVDAIGRTVYTARPPKASPWT